MKAYQSLCHTKWNCKYHVIPKRRKKKIYGGIRRYLGEIFHELAKQKEGQLAGRTLVYKLTGYLNSDFGLHATSSLNRCPPRLA